MIWICERVDRALSSNKVIEFLRFYLFGSCLTDPLNKQLIPSHQFDWKTTTLTDDRYHLAMLSAGGTATSGAMNLSSFSYFVYHAESMTLARGSGSLKTFTTKPGSTVITSTDSESAGGVTRWWLVETKYAARIFKNSFYSTVTAGSKRFDEMARQMRRLLDLAGEMGKKGVVFYTTTKKAAKYFRRLFRSAPDLRDAIDEGRLIFRTNNWW